MKSSSPAFDVAHSSPNKELRLVVKIDFPTPVYFTSHDDITIAGGTVFPSTLYRTSSTSAKLNPDEARTEIGTISFELIDKDGAITQHFRDELNNDNGLKGQFVELYSGYAGLDFDDFRLEQTQIIDKSLTHDGGSYKVQCRDIQREMRKDIFDLAKTRLSASISAGAATISVYDTNGFESNPHGTSYGEQPGQSVIYFKIKYKNGFEICSATGKTANTFTGVTRGLFGTKAIAHEAPQDSNPDNGPEVIEFVYLELPGPKLAYALMTGKLIGEANTIPSGWNLGIPEEYVDIDDFTGIGTDLYDPNDDAKGFICRFEAIEKTDGKRFIETQVCFPKMYLTVKANGKIGLKRMNGVLSNADYIDTLNASNITKASDLEQDFSRVHSVIDVHWSWYEFSGKKPQFYRRNTLIDQQSLVRHNKGKVDKPLTIQLKGLHNSRHTYTTLRNLFDALRDRYAGPPLGLKVDLLPSKNGLEIGDLVKVQLDHLRDFASDDTLDRTFEIQQVTIDQLSGKISATLFGSSEAAGPISDGASYVLPDGWYSSEGVNATTPLSIDGAGSLTADGTLTGGASSRSIYYYLGDLTIPSGRTLTITENVELRVRGHLQVDGEIQGGATSATGAKYLGTGQGGSGTYAEGWPASYGSIKWRGGINKGQHQTAPPIELENDAGVLRNVPDDMRGSQGGKGGDHLDAAGETLAAGGGGGVGGASLVVVARGMALGASGEVAMNGSNGQSGGSASAGAGGGGAPGCFYFLQDGSQGTTPFLSGKVASKFGQAGATGNPGKGGIVLGDATSRIIFIPQSRTPYPDYVVDENILSGAGRITRGTSFPDSPNEGDVHYDTANQNHAYVYDGASWVSVQDGEILDIAENAETTAMAAAEAADEAQIDATAANAQIADMGSDNKLTPVEKKKLILEVEEINEEDTDIIAKADLYGITTKKNSYVAGLNDLNNYLATLTSPVAWDNLSGNTTIDYTWFKSWFGLYYAKRQVLLNQIAEEAGKVADWNGVTGTGRPEDNATVGATAAQARQLGRATTVFNETFDTADSLEDWEKFINNGSSVWGATGASSVLIRGGGYLKIGDNSGNDECRWGHDQRIPFDADLLYKITMHVFIESGSGSIFCAVNGYKSDKTTLVNTVGSDSISSQHFFGGSFSGTGYKKMVGWFKGRAASGNGGLHPSPEDPGTMHNDVRYFSPMLMANFSGQAGVAYFDAVIVEAFDNRTMNNVHTTIISPNALRESVGIDQGDGVVRRAPFGLGAGHIRDGGSYTFGTPFNTPPIIKFRGGVTYSTTLTGRQNLVSKAINVSSSGFDASLRIKELAGGSTLRTDTSGAANVDGMDFVKHKSQSAQAWDDNYQFQIDVTVNNIYNEEFNTYFPGSVTVGYYTNDGSGWVKRGEKTFSGNNFSATQAHPNDEHTITVDGLTNHGGYEFAVDVISTSQAGGSITAFDNVKYYTATAPNDETGTPTGAEDAPFELLAGE